MIRPDTWFAAGDVARWVVLGLLLGAVTAGVGWTLLRATFEAPVFARQNYRGIDVPVGAGILIVFTSIVLSVVLAALSRDLLPTDGTYFVAVVAFGLLGFVDDIAAVGQDKGFRGHVGALLHGRLTTGGLKLVGGGIVALGLAGVLDRPDLTGVADHPWRILPDALLIALCANLGNLFDRAPGRTTKVATVAFVVLWALNLRADLGGAAIVVGAALGLLAFDLGEKLMLGDAGANALGATLGVAVLFSCSFPVRLVILLVVLALNGASEKVSFSRVIEATPPLRFLDRIGRRPA